MKYKVILFTAYCIWEEVEANTKEEAMNKCSYPPEFDGNDIHRWEAIEEEDETTDQ